MMMKEEVGEAAGCQQPPRPNPLLNPLVAANILSFLDQKNDLLSARRISKVWYDLGTDEILKRETIQSSITCTESKMENFLKLMTPSQRLPVARWTLVIPLFRLEAKVFLRLLKFIAPSAIWICINFTGIGCDQMTGLENLPYCKCSPLTLPRLEKLDAIVNVNDPSLHWVDMVGLVKMIILGGKNLVSFGTNFHSGLVVNCLPQALRKMHLSLSNWLGLGNVPYDHLIQSGFHLEEFLLTGTNGHSGVPEGLVHFLASQKDSLLRIEISNLEEIHRQHFHIFPQLEKVKKLRTTITCETTFEFIQRFPNVTELGLTLIPPYPYGRRKKVNDNLASILPSLPRHPSVRKVFIYSKHPPRINGMMISFQLLSHCFPQITHLSVHSFTDETMGKLTELLTYFQAIEWLAIGLKDNDGLELEATLSGRIGGGIGLSNLIRLRTLEIQATPQNYYHIFSTETLRRVFMRMVELREIRLVKENEVPQACQPFLERFHAMGVDFYCMKKRLWCTFP